jgi:hypothetical protein
MLDASQWFGPAADPAHRPQLVADVRAARTPEDVLAASLELFKLGDFSFTPINFDLACSLRDVTFVRSAVRVLQSVCTHDDLRQVDRMTFLARADPSVVQTFASGVWDTQSWEIAPYLLTLAEEWAEHHEIAEAVRFGLDELSGYTDELPEDADIDAIGEHVARRRAQLDPDRYYLGSQPSFSGLLTRRLAQAAMTSARSGARLGLAAEPSLLSIWSGIPCPVGPADVMDDASVQAVTGYIDRLVAMDWMPGQKYFYGHPVGAPVTELGHAAPQAENARPNTQEDTP